MKAWLRFALAVLLVGAGARYLWNHRSELDVLSQVGAAEIALVGLLLGAFFAATGYTFGLLVALTGTRLRPVEIAGLTLLTNFANYFGPTWPGAAAKAVYLKAEKRLAYGEFVAVLAANAFLVALVSGVAGLALVLAWRGYSGTLVLPLALASGAAALAGAAPLVLPFPDRPGQSRLPRPLAAAIDGFARLRSRRRQLAAVSASLLLQYAIAALLMLAAYDAIGRPLPFIAACMLAVFTSIANFFNVTPSNLGVQEMVMGYLATIAGASFAEGLLGAALIRALHALITFLGTPAAVYAMLRGARITWRELSTGTPPA
ncbi:MAG: lysylphosphatidylglycerol synthase domain-containing protein [Gammaproteobacteria bacterium]